MAEECEKCGKEFDSERGLHIHQSQVHKKQGQETKQDNEKMEQKQDESEKKNTEKTGQNQEGIRLNTKQTALISGTIGLTVGLAFTIGLLTGLLISTAPGGVPVEAPTAEQAGEQAAPSQDDQEGASTEEGNQEIEQLQEVPYDVEFGVGSQDVEWDGETVELEGRPRMGPSDAEVTVVSFEDFFCPFCGSFHNEDVAQQTDSNSAFPSIAENHIETGEVQYYFQQFPVVGGEYPAEVSECFMEYGGSEEFWTFQYNHFANFEEIQDLRQSSPDEYDEVVLSWAEQLDADTDSIESCMENGEMTSEVSSQAQEGQNLGATGTPAIFVEGELLEGAQPYSAFESVINDKL